MSSDLAQPGVVQVVEADQTWRDGRFESGVQVAIDSAGRIAEIGDLGREPDLRLAGRALLPGFVNAHSHAFQRGLRGHGERFPAGSGSFWTWREAMYGLVGRLDAERLFALSRAAFDEMRDAGMTSVGEFHYLHHDDAAAFDFAFDRVVLEAAAASGIRIVLLQAYYRSGGIGRPLADTQRRFATSDPAAYWRQIDRLQEALAGPGQSLGAVAHSIRAADPEEMEELHTEARRRGMVFHLHLEEQRQEIEACREAYGAAPIELLLDRLEPGPETTAVHCTHTPATQLARWTGGGAGVCLCPLTEANLADGIADLRSLDPAATLCLGSDSNARISMLEEMRWLEYVQRLAGERRGVLTDGAGDTAPRLLACATEHGANALGLDAGRIAVGRWADFAVIDLAAPQLAGWTPESLAASLVLGAGDGVVAGTCVGGAWRWSSDPE